MIKEDCYYEVIKRAFKFTTEIEREFYVRHNLDRAHFMLGELTQYLWTWIEERDEKEFEEDN